MELKERKRRTPMRINRRSFETILPELKKPKLIHTESRLDICTQDNVKYADLSSDTDSLPSIENGVLTPTKLSPAYTLNNKEYNDLRSSDTDSLPSIENGVMTHIKPSSSDLGAHVTRNGVFDVNEASSPTRDNEDLEGQSISTPDPTSLSLDNYEQIIPEDHHSNEKNDGRSAKPSLSSSAEQHNTESNLEIIDKTASSKQEESCGQFVLDPVEWSRIRPHEKEGQRLRLTGNWTEIFNKKLEEKYDRCVFVFRSNQVKREGSRKLKSPYFRGRAVCKMDSCTHEVLLVITETPKYDQDVVIKVSTKGYVNHISGPSARPLKGDARKEIVTEARINGTMNVFYSKLSAKDPNSLKSGNLNEVPSANVIRKAVSQCLSQEKLHRDTIQELMLLKDAYKSNDTDPNSRYGGYIQFIAVDPFTVILFGRSQITLACSIFKNQQLDFYLDATGTVVKRPKDQRKPFLYSLVINPDTTPPISVLDFISTDHTIPSICHALMFFARAAIQECPLFRPRKVETDWSYALIQSVLRTFNSTSYPTCPNTKTYLAVTHDVALGKVKNFDFTVVHICSAHMTKTASRALGKCSGKNKKLFKFLMTCFCLLSNETSVTEAMADFTDIAKVLLPECENEEIVQAGKRIQSRITECVEEREQICNDEDILVTPDEEGSMADKTIKESSPWYRDFSAIKHSLKATQQSTVGPTSEYFCVDGLDVLLNKFLPTFPMWSGLLLGEECRHNPQKFQTRDSNAAVESWFKMIKIDVLRRKTHLRPAEFVMKLKQSVNGRLIEQLHPEVRVKSKSKIKCLDLSEEIWSKQKSKRKNTHQPVQKKQLPQKKKLINKETPNAQKVQPEAKEMNDQSKVSRYPQVPKWGGKVEDCSLTNTCTLDNFLTIIHVLSTERPDMLEAFKADLSVPIENLLTSLLYMAEGKFDEAKLSWLTLNNIKNRSTEINMFGNEDDMYGRFVDELVKSQITSICSSPHCPSRIQERNLKGCFLHTSDGQQNCSTIQEMVNAWTTLEDSPCFAKFSNQDEQQQSPDQLVCADEVHDVESGTVNTTATYRCNGRRHSHRKILSLPPVLVLHVGDLVRLGHIMTEVESYSTELHIENKTYKLAGVTLHRRCHFVSAILSKRHGWLFYDGILGSLKTFEKTHLNRAVPEKLIYVA